MTPLQVPSKSKEAPSTHIQKGMTEWKKSLQALTSAQETQTRLIAKTKRGEEILLNCHLGIIPSGLFRNYVIGMLYPQQFPLAIVPL